MKKQLLGCLLAISMAGGSLFAQHRHVFIISIDGFRPDFYRQDEPWHTPHLHQLVQEGASSDGVTSDFPSITYPSHTTIVTGVPPLRHGIYFNNQFYPADPESIYWNFYQIKSPTIWQVAHDAGFRTASLMWPVSADAPVDFDMPDIGSLGEKIRETRSVPFGIVDSLKNELSDGQDIDYGKDVNVAKIACRVIKHNQPNLMTIHLFSVDHAEHMEGRSGPMVENAIRDADSAVYLIRKAIKDAGIEDSTLLIVTGDHGFNNVKMEISPNVWLEQAGLYQKKNPLAWKARFHAAGGSSFLFLHNKHDKETLKAVTRILNEHQKEAGSYFRIISKKELDAVGADPDAALALSGINDGAFNNNTEGRAVSPSHGGTHGHFPDSYNIKTGLLVIGPGIKKGYIIKNMNLKDITSIALLFLKLDMPSAEGKSPDIWQ